MATKFPLLIIDANDRTNRPREQGYGEWLSRVKPMIAYMKSSFFEKYGETLSDEDVFTYIAWSMETSLNRLMWSLQYDPEASSLVASAAYDSMERYIGYRRGMWPAPRGERFESPAEFETMFAMTRVPRSPDNIVSKQDDRGYGTYL